ncbi:uncharacterized protein LOC130243277 [Danio aesculapii]|uniref:uncharacterized protein LOC130243277 n=1 Tax=Danio aesculapii TaxID=1142201 RepID=UPI0024C027A5|nr:uncharacterized protein LOC130243277 [Danio aesculapii]
MEPTRSSVLGPKAEAGTRKDRSWAKGNWWDKQKVSNESKFYKLDLKITEYGLTGNMGGKNDKGPHNQASGHGIKGQNLTKHSKAKKTPEDQKKKESKGQWRNEKAQIEPVTVKKSTKGPQLHPSNQISSGAGVQSESKIAVTSLVVQDKKGFGAGSGHSTKVFVPEKAKPGSRLVTKPGSCPSEISISDYLLLLKCLQINLPDGVLNPKVIKLSQTADVIQKAQDIVKDLENFKLQFNSIPRLGSREVKNSLSLKDNNKVYEITQMIFFKKNEGSDEDLRTQWKKNASNTNCGFRFRDKYKTTAVSTPAMYATAQTRSWRHLKDGEKHANISAGVTVNVSEIEKRDYRDNSTLWTTSSPQRFGKYFQNPAGENECLKFYHELCEIGANRTVKYTKGNKVESGFLSGRLDFLAEIKEEKTEKIVIECKGTTGDMVGKVFTKPTNGGRFAKLNETHEYYYQVQAYMYILNQSAKQTQRFTSYRAVMVIQHYHKNGQEPRDFYWNYLRKNEAIQQKISELCVFCEEEVLACFLAVLNLIFQKDSWSQNS